jgi:hypothetical protein
VNPPVEKVRNREAILNKAFDLKVRGWITPSTPGKSSSFHCCECSRNGLKRFLLQVNDGENIPHQRRTVELRYAEDFRCVLIRLTGRDCNIERNYPVRSSFTRVSPSRCRLSTAFHLSNTSVQIKRAVAGSEHCFYRFYASKCRKGGHSLTIQSLRLCQSLRTVRDKKQKQNHACRLMYDRHSRREQMLMNSIQRWLISDVLCAKHRGIRTPNITPDYADYDDQYHTLM